MAGNVWVVLEHREGKLHPIALEAITAGRRLAQELGCAVEAVLLGSGMEALASEAARSGVERVHVGDTESLAEYTPGAYVAALSESLSTAAPSFVVFGHSYQSVDCMARVAHAIGAAILPEAISFESSDQGLVFTRPILQGKMHSKVRLKGEGTAVVSFQSASFEAATTSQPTTDQPAAEIVPLVGDPGAWQADRELLGVEDVVGDAVDLSAAEKIVSVGRGIGGPEKMEIVEELAKALGAEIGASRPVIDNGWLPRDRQIGSSGQTVAPKLYVAVGISGAIQHLVGMKGAACTVAINKDPGAPIFTVADYGIVGDLFEVLPALSAAIREAGS